MENQITLNFVGYTILIGALGFAFGFFMREVLYNAVKNAAPKKKTRVKRVKAETQLLKTPTDTV